MNMLGKLIGLWAMGKTVSSTTPIFMRLGLSMAAIIALGTFLLLLSTILLVSLLWLLHLQLVLHGMEPIEATYIVIATVITMMLVIALAIRLYVGRIQTNMREIAYAHSPVGGRVSYIVDSFMRGFTHDAQI